MEALEHTLPSQYWIEINRLLVPFGKHICTGGLPKCCRDDRALLRLLPGIDDMTPHPDALTIECSAELSSR